MDRPIVFAALFLAAGLAIYSVGGFLYVLGSSVMDIVLVRFLQGVGGGFVFSVSLAYMADLAPKGYEGRYMGLYNVLFHWTLWPTGYSLR